MYSAWLSTFTKAELVNLLDQVFETGVLPVIPPASVLEALSPEHRRGRPRGTSDMDRVNALTAALSECWPREVSLRDVARAAGLSYSATVRLRQVAYLLPEGLREYFLALPEAACRYRMSPLWRAVIDLHNYTLLLRQMDTTALYTIHAGMWGPAAVKAALHSNRLDLLNQSELRRLTDPVFLELVAEAGWPVPPPESQEGWVEEGCPLLAARGRPLQTVGDVHGLLVYDGHCLPLDPASTVPLVYTSNRRTVLERILHVSPS